MCSFLPSGLGNRAHDEATEILKQLRVKGQTVSKEGQLFMKEVDGGVVGGILCPATKVTSAYEWSAKYRIGLVTVHPLKVF